jgi:hypothetical protein
MAQCALLGMLRVLSMCQLCCSSGTDVTPKALFPQYSHPSHRRVHTCLFNPNSMHAVLYVASTWYQENGTVGMLTSDRTVHGGVCVVVVVPGIVYLSIPVSP